MPPSNTGRKLVSDVPYAPGDRVLFSGIYQARHASHRPPHEVTAVDGGVFPSCRMCGTELQFVPVRLADRLHEDYDFPIVGTVSVGRAAH